MVCRTTRMLQSTHPYQQSYRPHLVRCRTYAVVLLVCCYPCTFFCFCKTEIVKLCSLCYVHTQCLDVSLCAYGHFIFIQTFFAGPEKTAILQDIVKSIEDPISALDGLFRKTVELTYPVLVSHLKEGFLEDAVRAMNILMENGKSNLIQHLISALQPSDNRPTRLPLDRMPYGLLERTIR